MAWAALEESERSELDSQKDMRQLFEALNEADETHNQKSRLRRGLKLVGPYLQRIGFLVDLASPFVSLNPTAATAHGLIKGSIAILTAVCGAGEDLTADIESFLQRIPAIERINGVVKSSEELPDIHKALVAVYKDLFGFILKLNAIFKRKRFAMTMAINALRPELPGFVSSFNKDADVLSKLLDAEVFATILQIKEEINDANIGSNLDVEEENLTALRRKLRQRADDACDWIASDEVFCDWKDAESNTSILVMLGDLGCGKTITTAFVSDKGVPADAVVCSYYITGHTQTAETPVILRSLMWQLIQAKPNMKRDFLQWFKHATTPTNIFRQSSFDDKIRQFLRHALLASKDVVFFVLDALDECDITVQRELSALFDDLLDNDAPLKVFISMRHNEEAESVLPKNSVQIEHKTSAEQSRIIAGYLAEQLNIPKDIRTQVVEELSSKAEGSAIWIRMALEYCKKSKTISQTGLKAAMDELLTFKGLTEMYWQLFQKCKADLDENEEMLSIALDTLAVSKRPLTVEELSYAVCIELDREYGAETLQELDDLASSRNFFEIVQPFVHKLPVNNGKDQLRLVHHSLRELILRRPAAEWMQTAKTKLKRGERPPTRKPQLEGHILQRCVNYLLYDECRENRLPFLDSGDLLFEVGDVFHDSDDEGTFPETETSKTERFDPKAFGFGGFYAYAASCWTHHFTHAADDLAPSADQLITLCSKDDPRTLNWTASQRSVLTCPACTGTANF
ncbi:hypothetical protein NQ176_g8510 [Zarea fungicola]|uniref:Uncharacterized protein n=1 Tax=Zarea fungicola TaxID=93591 RepID=A0ACC1MU12_9HYPO|nr:hypothetical protein NQ176_g8510 [Lecanicillium fungicola]